MVNLKHRVVDRFELENPKHLLGFLLGWFAGDAWAKNPNLLKNLERRFSYSGTAYRSSSTDVVFCPSSWSKTLSGLKSYLQSDFGIAIIVQAKLIRALDLESVAEFVIKQLKPKDIEVYEIQKVREVVCLNVPISLKTLSGEK